MLTPIDFIDAPCIAVGFDFFFQEEEEKTKRKEYLALETAKKICMSCEYQKPCLDWALKNREKGIWGGTTEQDRNQMRKYARTA